MQGEPHTALGGEMGLERKEAVIVSNVVSRPPTADAALKSQIFPEAEPLSKDLTRETCKIGPFPEG